MRRLVVATVTAALTAGLFAAGATAGTVSTPEQAKPGWYTKKLHKRVLKAGRRGVAVGEERLNTECPGVQSRGVSAAGCIVAPSGCTANFIFGGAGHWHIGTARHCVGGVGDELVMQVDSTTLASVGTVVKRTSGDGEPGNDFALIKIDSGVAAKWGVNPAIPVIGGPSGVYTGCGPVPVEYYGHGYGVAVAQGKPEGGLAADWRNDAYSWAGFGAPGDSGSPVITSSGQAAGNFTHLVVGGFAGNLAGMRATRIIQFARMPIVNADGTTSGGGSTDCGGALNVRRLLRGLR
jgi:hypothetical protein